MGLSKELCGSMTELCGPHSEMGRSQKEMGGPQKEMGGSLRPDHRCHQRCQCSVAGDYSGCLYADLRLERIT